MADSSWTAKGKGLWLLLRPLPVLAWTGGAFILSVGLAYRAGLPLLWHQLGRAFLVASIVQGWLAHSLNDRTDWVSGTDQEADQFLSGGSGVIQQGLFDLPQLLGIAAASGMLIFVLVRRSVDLRLYFLLGVGCWGAVAYSAKPWRLAYVPLAGEWAAAFPAIVACGLALYQAAAGGITGLVLMASILHGLMAIAWLMQHHLPDWERDLQAAPPKYTTVAWVAAEHGGQTARLVIVGYYVLAALVAVLCSITQVRFLWTAVTAASCALLAYRQDVASTQQMAQRELQMIGLNLLHAWIVGWLA